MTVTVTAISRCSGTNHVTVTATVDGQSRTETFLRSDLDLEPAETRAAVIARLRSAVKEANASTPVQISNALVGNTFKV